MISGGEFSDDPTIVDPEELWRRIPPRHFVFDENANAWRPSSAAFDNDQSGHPMSVVIESTVIATHRGPNEVLAGHAGFALASFSAGAARQFRQGIQRDPISEEPAHALVFGAKTKSTMRALAKSSHWIVKPETQPPRND